MRGFNLKRVLSDIVRNQLSLLQHLKAKTLKESAKKPQNKHMFQIGLKKKTSANDTHTYVCMRVYTLTHTCTYINTHTYTQYIYIYVYVCMRVCVYS